MCDGDKINAAILQLPEVTPIVRETGQAEALDSFLEQQEKDKIVAALDQTRWNKTAAAKLLGISFRALRYRLDKLGIE